MVVFQVTLGDWNQITLSRQFEFPVPVNSTSMTKSVQTHTVLECAFRCSWRKSCYSFLFVGEICSIFDSLLKNGISNQGQDVSKYSYFHKPSKFVFIDIYSRALKTQHPDVHHYLKEILKIIPQRISGDFMNAKYGHHMDFIRFNVIFKLTSILHDS